MKRIAIGLVLIAIGCSSATEEFHVTAYRTVEGVEAAPWHSGCLVTVENKTQHVEGLYGLPCGEIEIGDVAVFNHKGDTVFWVKKVPYSVRSTRAK